LGREISETYFVAADMLSSIQFSSAANCRVVAESCRFLESLVRTKRILFQRHQNFSNCFMTLGHPRKGEVLCSIRSTGEFSVPSVYLKNSTKSN